MNAVMARILGLAGSGGVLRWAWTQGAKKINVEQKRTEMRKLPRRIGDLQMGRSGACLPQAGWAPTRYRIWRRRCWIWRCAVQLAQPACGRQACCAATTERNTKRELHEGGDAGDALADDELVD